MAKRGPKTRGVLYRFHITPGLFIGSYVKCADNSGAKVVKIIGIVGHHAKTVRRRIPGAAVGDMVVVSVREATKPELRKQVMRAIVIRQKRPYRRPDGTWIAFEDNAVVIVSPEGDPKGSEIRGPVAREVLERWPKVGGLAQMVV